MGSSHSGIYSLDAECRLAVTGKVHHSSPKWGNPELFDVDDRVFTGIDLHSDEQVLRRRVIKPTPITHLPERRRLPILRPLEDHRRWLPHVMHHPLILAILLRLDLQPHDI